MRDRNKLSLPEEILLLALRDEQGTIEMESTYSFAVGGAVIAELLMSGRIRLDQQRKKKLVSLIDARPTGKPFLDDCLTRIEESKKQRTPEDWVTRFANTRELKHRLARQLCDRGILRADEDKVLLLFTRRIYPEVDPAPERDLLERLRQAIFIDDTQVEPRTAVIASLANSANLLDNPFGKKKLKARKARLEAIANGDASVQATKEAIEAMQAAILVACIVPIIATTVATH